nr:hypothetical protein Q903MT_gene1643 [Picea sitchensis]
MKSYDKSVPTNNCPILSIVVPTGGNWHQNTRHILWYATAWGDSMRRHRTGQYTGKEPNKWYSMGLLQIHIEIHVEVTQCDYEVTQ